MENERKILKEKMKAYFGDPDSNAADMPLKDMERYMALISSDISDAIGGVDRFNAPFIILILEQYAAGLLRRFPASRAICEVLSQMCIQQEVAVVLPELPKEKEGGEE